ncbi:integration host factor subunit alpha [Thermodesulfovibrio aggregans]|uniref:Integration host factor subunit alpha n=1 Tax=Thermodesulfovibrio aggregans TaxID=86166 RepID=A0A0U9HWU3_9BACT|nr:integration host factor subunit alpha [Thermodesulfovibrio aggregans]GAQ94959.1 integration host factor subunit alpha [Thermodesulfovibrio aggregans]
MTKADLINFIFERVGLPKTEIQKIVETVFDTIKEALKEEEVVKISGFGVFTVRRKGSRIGRNPKTMQTVEIKPRKVVTFRPSEQLKQRIQKSMS